jgi:hypothetical protein
MSAPHRNLSVRQCARFETPTTGNGLDKTYELSTGALSIDGGPSVGAGDFAGGGESVVINPVNGSTSLRIEPLSMRVSMTRNGGLDPESFLDWIEAILTGDDDVEREVELFMGNQQTLLQTLGSYGGVWLTYVRFFDPSRVDSGGLVRIGFDVVMQAKERD